MEIAEEDIIMALVFSFITMVAISWFCYWLGQTLEKWRHEKQNEIGLCYDVAVISISGGKTLIEIVKSALEDIEEEENLIIE